MQGITIRPSDHELLPPSPGEWCRNKSKQSHFSCLIVYGIIKNVLFKCMVANKLGIRTTKKVRDTTASTLDIFLIICTSHSIATTIRTGWTRSLNHEEVLKQRDPAG